LPDNHRLISAGSRFSFSAMSIIFIMVVILCQCLSIVKEKMTFCQFFYKCLSLLTIIGIDGTEMGGYV
jgi:hypothetical protein